MKTFNETQLSTILGEHDAGNLINKGARCWIPNPFSPLPAPAGCINQAAYNEPAPGSALMRNQPAGRWFDYEYRREDSVEYLLLRLEEKGFARLP